MANKILDLFDERTILEIFNETILPLYPDFSAIDSVVINPKKNNVWSETYHVVIEYITRFVGPDGRRAEKSIFATAHDSEPRNVVFNNLKLLADNGFIDDEPISPRPLFHSPLYNATFYEGISGHTLYHYLRSDNRQEVISHLPAVASWFARLHSLDITAPGFTMNVQTVDLVVPGLEKVLQKINERSPHLLPIFESIYSEMISKEKKSIADKSNLRIIHGDAHAENVIITKNGQVAVIDFTDMTLSDFARDIGSFLQQLEFKIMNISTDASFAEQAKNLFLSNYIENAKIELTDDLAARIATYHAFTAMRTATYFLVKHDPAPHRSLPLILQAAAKLNLEIPDLR